MRIGFVGLGRMGGRMARNLLAAGHTLTVHDLDPAATAPLRELGAAWADSPQLVAEASDVVMASLPGRARSRKSRLATPVSCTGWPRARCS